MNEILLAIFLATQLGDFITTKIALDKGGGESNPLVKAAIDKLGLLGLALWKFWASGLMGVVYYTGLLDPVFPHLTVVMIMFYGFILVNNIKVIRKLA